MESSQTSTTDEGKGRNPKGGKGAESVGADQVQATVDAENEQGFRGVKVDPTPDSHYSVAGVTAGLPTPETDADAYAEAHHKPRIEGQFPKA